MRGADGTTTHFSFFGLSHFIRSCPSPVSAVRQGNEKASRSPTAASDEHCWLLRTPVEINEVWQATGHSPLFWWQVLHSLIVAPCGTGTSMVGRGPLEAREIEETSQWYFVYSLVLIRLAFIVQYRYRLAVAARSAHRFCSSKRQENHLA